MSMGSVPNCRKEIANRYGIRWFKCKLKPPKKEVRDSLHKEYDLKIELIEENTKRDLAVKEADFKTKMENQEKQYDILLNTALDKVKLKYESKMKDFTRTSES